MEVYVSNGVKKLDQPEPVGPGLRTTYRGGYLLMFQIAVRENEPVYTEGMRKNYEKADPADVIEGVGDWAHIDHSGTNMQSIYFAYGDTFISITIDGKLEKKAYDKDELNAWLIEKVTEAGRLAAERLDAILK